MADRSVVVLGGGVSGLAAALLLARDGHRVTVVERDDLDCGDALDSPGWRRRGIPHFHQPHAFIPRGRSELKRHLPDVYDDLLAAGTGTVDLCRHLALGEASFGGSLGHVAYLGVWFVGGCLIANATYRRRLVQ